MWLTRALYVNTRLSKTKHNEVDNAENFFFNKAFLRILQESLCVFNLFGVLNRTLIVWPAAALTSYIEFGRNWLFSPINCVVRFSRKLSVVPKLAAAPVLTTSTIFSNLRRDLFHRSFAQHENRLSIFSSPVRLNYLNNKKFFIVLRICANIFFFFIRYQKQA